MLDFTRRSTPPGAPASVTVDRVNRPDWPPNGVWPPPFPPPDSPASHYHRWILWTWTHENGGASADDLVPLLKTNDGVGRLRAHLVDFIRLGLLDTTDVQRTACRTLIAEIVHAIDRGHVQWVLDHDVAGRFRRVTGKPAINALAKEIATAFHTAFPDSLMPMYLFHEQNALEGLVGEEIIEKLKDLPPKDQKEVIKDALAQIQREIAIGKAELSSLAKQELRPFIEFCKTVRGCDVPATAGELGAHLMGLGRMFLGKEALTAADLAEQLETIESAAKKLGGIYEVAPNAAQAFGWLASLLGGDAIHGSYTVLFARNWARAGFPVIEVGHKVAASLMFTHGTDDIDPPWSAFGVKVPDELVTVGGLTLARVLVLHMASEPAEESSAKWLLRLVFREQADRSFFSLFVGLRTLDEDASAIRARMENGPTERRYPVDEMARAVQMIGHLVAGGCMLISAKEDITEQPWRPKAPPERRRLPGIEPPEGTRFIVSKNIEIDLRNQVTEYIAGARKGAKLTVQFVVRGHRRWQACGPRHSERKLIWINPFWKGPEDGRALLRGYEIKGNAESS